MVAEQRWTPADAVILYRWSVITANKRVSAATSQYRKDPPFYAKHSNAVAEVKRTFGYNICIIWGGKVVQALRVLMFCTHLVLLALQEAIIGASRPWIGQKKLYLHWFLACVFTIIIKYIFHCMELPNARNVLLRLSSFSLFVHTLHPLAIFKNARTETIAPPYQMFVENTSYCEGFMLIKAGTVRDKGCSNYRMKKDTTI